MPEAATRYLGFMRARIAEELAFLPGSSLYSCICAGGGGSLRAGERTIKSQPPAHNSHDPSALARSARPAALSTT